MRQRKGVNERRDEHEAEGKGKGNDQDGEEDGIQGKGKERADPTRAEAAAFEEREELEFEKSGQAIVANLTDEAAIARSEAEAHAEVLRAVAAQETPSQRSALREKVVRIATEHTLAMEKARIVWKRRNDETRHLESFASAYDSSSDDDEQPMATFRSIPRIRHVKRGVAMMRVNREAVRPEKAIVVNLRERVKDWFQQVFRIPWRKPNKFWEMTRKENY